EVLRSEVPRRVACPFRRRPSPGRARCGPRAVERSFPQAALRRRQNLRRRQSVDLLPLPIAQALPRLHAAQAAWPREPPLPSTEGSRSAGLVSRQKLLRVSARRGSSLPALPSRTDSGTERGTVGRG